MNSLLLKLVGIALNKDRAAVTNSFGVLALTSFCMVSTAVSSSIPSVCVSKCIDAWTISVLIAAGSRLNVVTRKFLTFLPVCLGFLFFSRYFSSYPLSYRSSAITWNFLTAISLNFKTSVGLQAGFYWGHHTKVWSTSVSTKGSSWNQQESTEDIVRITFLWISRWE